MASDIPAAHSMDTRWFAVDSDGRVGLFETSEDGALPWAAESRDFDEWPLEALAAARAVAEGQLAPENEPHFLREHALILLTADPDARLALSWLVADLEVANIDHVSVLATTSPLSPGLLQRLLSHPRVEQLVVRDDVQRWLEGDDSPLFRFRHSFESLEPGFYRKANRPRGPGLSISELPGPLASVVARVSLPLRFATIDALHLADHFREVDCHTWMSRPLRG